MAQTDEAPAAHSLVGGLALATETLGAAFFLGLAGVVFAWGHDGLAFGLGIGAGCLLLQLLVVPLLPQTGARSLREFLAQRFPGRVPQAATAIVVVASMTLLLAAQLMAAGLVLSRLLGFDAVSATAAAAVVAFVVFAMRARPLWISGLLFLVLLAALLIPLGVLSAERYSVPVPQIAYANALWQIQGLEQTLLEQDLADPAVLKPMLTPFLSLNAVNFLGVVLGLALGIAALPSLLSRYFAMPSSGVARSSSVWTLVFVALIVTAAPAAAAYVRLALLTLVGDHTPFANLPAWIFTYGRIGLVDICGRAASDPVVVAQACAALPDAPTMLRLQDITLAPDMITLALPEITGLGAAMFGLMAGAGLAAALLTAAGPMHAIVQAVDADRNADKVDGGFLTPWAVAGLGLLAAGIIAAVRPADMPTVATWSLTLAASGLFPALVAGLWWRGAAARGAVPAMLIGFTLALVYIVATHCFAVDFFETFGSLSSAGPIARETFGELKDAWAAAEPGAAKDAAWTALVAHARLVANVWGINGLASVLLSLPAAVLVLVLGSLLSRTKTASQSAAC